jgi:hypothetical protein
VEICIFYKTNEREDEMENRTNLSEAAYKLKNGEIVTGKTHLEAWKKIYPELGVLPLEEMSEDDAMKQIINDSEIHFQIDNSILASPDNYFEFLYTEVKFHAECYDLDFNKAKGAYEFWAKENHTVAFDDSDTWDRIQMLGTIKA